MEKSKIFIQTRGNNGPTMKLYFVLLVVLVATASAKKGGKHNQQKMADMQECMKENDATMEEVKSSFRIENPSHNVKCVFYCISKKMGMITAEGTIDVDKVVERFGKDEKSAAAIRQCYETTKGQGDMCESTYAFKKCSMKLVGMGKGGRRKPKDDDEDEDDNV